MTAPEHFDSLETRDPEVREREQLAALARQVAHAKAHAPAFARILSDVDAGSVTTRAALAKVPVTRKSQLLEIQKQSRPFGGFATTQWGRSSDAPLHMAAGKPRRRSADSRAGWSLRPA